jgi:hypothetical protein
LWHRGLLLNPAARAPETGARRDTAPAVMRRMSIQDATGVDVAAGAPAATVAMISTTHRRKDSTAMTPIAAYYVLVMTDNERQMRRARHDSTVPGASLASRIVAALESLVRLGRPATTQPA